MGLSGKSDQGGAEGETLNKWAIETPGLSVKLVKFALSLINCALL